MVDADGKPINGYNLTDEINEQVARAICSEVGEVFIKETLKERSSPEATLSTSSKPRFPISSHKASLPQETLKENNDKRKLKRGFASLTHTNPPPFIKGGG